MMLTRASAGVPIRLARMARNEPGEEEARHEEAVAHRGAVVESEYGAALLRLFAEVDPWGLIAIGAPWDEYWSEVQAIMGRNHVTADDVMETFRRFAMVTGRDGRLLDPQPDENMPVSQADAQRLADGITRLRHE